MATHSNCNQEINARISKANQAFAVFKAVWRSAGLGFHTEIKTFKSNVLSVFLYGSVLEDNCHHQAEVRGLPEQVLEAHLQIFDPVQPPMKTFEIRTGMSSIEKTIQAQHWQWLRHVCHMPRSSRPRKQWTLQGKRNRGQLKGTWRQTVERDMKNRGLNLKTVPEAAVDKVSWRSLAISSCARQHRKDWVNE